MKKIITILILTLFTCSCGLNQKKIQINSNKIETRRGVISEASPKNFNITRSIDSRINKYISYENNDFGGKLYYINSNKPVNNIVSEAFVNMLEKNGHKVNSNNPDINVELDVKRFEFDDQENFASFETMAFVETNIRLIDARTSKLLMDQTYKGTENKKSIVVHDFTWIKTMSSAISDMLEKISLSSKFANAISQ